MKIMFLNVMSLGIKNPLEKYIKEKAEEIDIFCFQEAYDTAEFTLKEWLPGFKGYSDNKKFTDFSRFTQLTLIKEGIELVETATIMKNYTDTGLAIHTKIKKGEAILNLCNVHGIVSPRDNKLDNPARLKQSKALLNFYKEISGPTIIGGDFNAELNIKSLKVFNDYRYTNLIEKYEILTTRNHLAWDLYPETPQMYADHVFVTPEISVKNFTVENIEISDHLPIILEI